MTTPVLVQSTAVAITATSATATFTSPNTAGNFLIAFGWAGSGAANLTFSDPTNGNYYRVVSGPSGANQMAIAIIPLPTPTINNAGQGVTVTMNANVSISLRLVIQEWSGLDATNPMFIVDQVLAVTGGTSTTPSAGTFATMAEAGELALVWAIAGASETWTAGSGFTLDPNITNPAQRMVEYQVVSGTTGPVGSITMSGSTTWVACGVALRSAKTRKVIAITSGTTFSAPADWPGTADRVDVIGGGGAGRAANDAATQEGTGGGGGAYTYIYNLLIANGAAIQVGTGGQTSHANGTGTWVVASGTLFAPGGNGAAASNPGSGGLASNCIPAANGNSGGNGGAWTNNATSGAGGGGGAAGPYGDGARGGNQATGVSGGTGGGGGGGGTAGANQVAATQSGTAGGNAGSAGGPVSTTGGTGGASGIHDGSSGTGINFNSGGGGGGGGSDGAGAGGAGGAGAAGGEFSLTVGGTVGSGGGGAGTGQITGGGSPAAGAGGLYGAGGGGGGGHGTASMFGKGGGGLIVITYTPSGLSAQTITSSIGNLGYNVADPFTAFTPSFTEGTATEAIDLFLAAQTVNLNEGNVIFGQVLAAQTITLTEGTITISEAGDVTTSISAQTMQFAQGAMLDVVSYLLDQNTVIIVGQTVTTVVGTISLGLPLTVAPFSIAAAEGTVTDSLSTALTAQTIASVEGAITATAGSNENIVLGNLFINSVLGVPGKELDYFPTAQSITSVLGTITFSEQAGSFLLTAQTITSTIGMITVTGPSVGTGPPLFIPPQLGKPVTTRTFSFADMAMRAWGSEFRAPDHRVYQFSGGNYKDSTDMGETGIYRRP